MARSTYRPGGTAAMTRHAPALCLAAGVLGVAGGAWLALVEPAVGEDAFSYPLTAGGFVVAQLWFTVHHLGLLAGLVALRHTDALPAGRRASRGLRLAVAGMVGLTVTELVAALAADTTVDSALAGAVGALYGVTCLALGVGLVMAGNAIARGRTWTGWRRWVVLALGVWVFVPMFPALVLTPTDGSRWAIAGWMALFAALGLALRDARPARSTTTASAAAA